MDKSQLEPFLEPQDIDKKMPDFLTEEECQQMKARSKLFFETLWKAMGK